MVMVYVNVLTQYFLAGAEKSHEIFQSTGPGAGNRIWDLLKAKHK